MAETPADDEVLAHVQTGDGSESLFGDVCGESSSNIQYSRAARAASLEIFFLLLFSFSQYEGIVV